MLRFLTLMVLLVGLGCTTAETPPAPPDRPGADPSRRIDYAAPTTRASLDYSLVQTLENGDTQHGLFALSAGAVPALITNANCTGRTLSAQEMHNLCPDDNMYCWNLCQDSPWARVNIADVLVQVMYPSYIYSEAYDYHDFGDWYAPSWLIFRNFQWMNAPIMPVTAPWQASLFMQHGSRETQDEYMMFNVHSYVASVNVMAVHPLPNSAGLIRIGHPHLFLVNRDGTQTEYPTEMVAVQPGLTPWENGGLLHAINWACPRWALEATNVHYRCNNSTADEPDTSAGTPLLN